MKITKLFLTKEKIALKVPFVTALRRVFFAEFIRLRMETDSGMFAYGEAPATKAVTGETLESIFEAIDGMRPLLKGKTPQEALLIVHQQLCGSSAKAAVDMALVSLMAQEQNLSFGSYLGIKDYDPLETDITISLNNAASMLADAKEAFTAGMHTLKIKLGGDIEHAVAVSRLLAKELPQATLLMDANQAWSEAETIAYLQAVSDLDIALLEQPVAADALDALARITAKSTIPILADEALFTLADAQAVIERRAADMINVKVMKCGGISKAIEIFEYAREKGVQCMLGSMIEGPYSINYTLYLAFAYRDVIAFVDLDSPLLYKSFPQELDFEYKGSLITPRDRPVLQ